MVKEYIKIQICTSICMDILLLTLSCWNVIENSVSIIIHLVYC